MRLRSDWKKLLLYAWSIRMLGGAFLVIVAETALPYFEGVLPVPRWLFGTLCGVFIAAAFFARLIAQKRFEEQ